MRTHRPPYGSSGQHVCGCYFFDADTRVRTYLPQVKLDAHTTILSTASRTVLRQTFINSSKNKPLGEIRYAFPLFDGVSVVDFVCHIGERTIYGLVKEKGEARKVYEEAKERGESAALLEQLPDAADVFTTAVSNIPADSSVKVTITYVQELKHDAEVDGVRLTIPTSISPRYGSYPGQLQDSSALNDAKGISLTVDVSMAEGIPIKKVISPSHPIEVSLGSLSTSAINENASVSKASATLALGTTELEKDFVLQVAAKDVGIPQAIMETHPMLPNQRALMTTLVPKFNLRSHMPEIIFIADRSGSMEGNIPTLVSALKVFLKSIPVGCMFNICSFGSGYHFLWPKSRVYGQDTLAEAIRHVDRFEADFGGTETLKAVKACCEARHKELSTELMLLTDGDIWAQQQMFDYISKETQSGDVRVFPIGIGRGVSSALIEGVARAGRGFAQMVTDNEKLDSKIVRMLKGALTPHIKDYRIEVKYEDDSVEKVADSLRVQLCISDKERKEKEATKTDETPISLYDPNSTEEHPKADEPQDIFAGLPKLNRPKVLQTPHEIPQLFPFNRTCVYLLMAPEASHLKPKSVVLKGSSPQGPLELEIPVETRKEPDEMIHQLAARKAIQELEEGRGWISEATVDDTGLLVKNKHPAQFNLLQRREAVRLGVEFQVGGKYCSFVAVEANESEIVEKRKKALEMTINRDVRGKEEEEEEEEEDNWDMLEEDEQELSSGTLSSTKSGKKFRKKGKKALTLSDSLMTTAGNAPQRQLATKASRKCAPSTASVKKTARKRRADPWTARKTRKHVDKITAPTGNSGPGLVTLCSLDVDCEAEAEDSENGQGRLFFDCEAEAEDSENGQGRLFLYDAGPTCASDSVASMNVRTGSSKEQPNETGILLERLIALQTFEGSWTGITNLLCTEMKISGDAARSAVDKLVDASNQGLDRAKAEQVLSTAIVIAFLEQKMESEEDTWELVVEKARTWLADGVADDVLAEAWKLADGIVAA